jgi:hypothetical protein
MNGEFDFLGRTVYFKDWHTVNKVRWPLDSSFKINYYGKNRIDDIKIIWELNRMQFLQLLSKAYFLTKKEEYSQKVIDYINSWIDENPYLRGVNWMEGIEAAVRMYSWIFAYFYIVSSSSLDGTFNKKILKSIYQHAKFIRNFISDKWIINNNHIFAELSGLILIGLSFPQFKESTEWINFGLKKLKKEVNRQIFDDGFLWEHSLGYHKFVTELIILVIILLKKNRYNVPKSIMSKLNKMLKNLYLVSMKNNKIPIIGDEDQARVINLGFEQYDDISEILSLGSFLFNINSFKQKNNSELVFWLFNGGKKSKYDSVSLEFSFKVFEDSGYGVFKSKNGYLLFITSAQKEKYLHAGHRHLDMLSFIFEKNGEYFIVDPGTYTYFADDKIRNKFRGISMHNTITIDKKNPSDLSGLFELYPRPKTKLVDYGTLNRNINYIWSTHNGYKPLIHNRIIFQLKEGFIIYDFIKGDSKKHIFENILHLHPEVEIVQKDEKKILLKKNSEKIFISSDEKIIEINSNFSPRYGIINESKALKIQTKDKYYEKRIYISNNENAMETIDFNLSDFINKKLTYAK